MTLFVIQSAPASADVAKDIQAVLADPLLAKANVGLQVVRLGKSESDIALVCQSNSLMPLIPASNLKVITTSAALDRLGADFTFRTLLLKHNDDLIVIGDGDPTLGDAEMLKKVGWDVDTVFKAWAATLAKRHITSAARLVVDDSVFDQQLLHPNWPADQYQDHYMAEVAGLNLNANCVNLFVQPTSPGQLVGVTFSPFTSYIKIKNSCLTGGDNAQLSRQPDGNDLTLRGTARIANIIPYAMTVHDPALYAGTFLADTLKANGISISGDVVRDRSMRAGYAQALANHDPSWTLLAVHETSLPSVISRANKDSMNLYAECICKRLGYADTGQGTWATGTGSVAKFLLGLKISSDQFQLDDGCGLSKQNAISANLMVKVLTHDYFSKDSQTWMGCLSVAGEDGTLLDRFHGYDLKGRVIAKTGFVNKVSCLSGYLHTKDDSWYCFSILFNGIPDGTNSTAKILQEKIVHAIDANAGK